MTQKAREVLQQLRTSAKPIRQIKSYSTFPGIYAVFLSQARLPIADTTLARGSLIYIGKTESSQVARDLKQHLKDGETGSSTLRRSLAALLLDKLELSPRSRSDVETSERRFTNFKLDDRGEARLTKWMKNNLTLAFVECKLPISKLRLLEKEVIKISIPALNLNNNLQNALRRDVRLARKRCANLARRTAI